MPSPCNAYGAAKIAFRYLCYDYSTRNDIYFIYSNIAGIYSADRKDNNVIYYTISIIGEYVYRIFDETRNRPPFIISKEE